MNVSYRYVEPEPKFNVDSLLFNMIHFDTESQESSIKNTTNAQKHAHTQKITVGRQMVERYNKGFILLLVCVQN